MRGGVRREPAVDHCETVTAQRAPAFAHASGQLTQPRDPRRPIFDGHFFPPQTVPEAFSKRPLAAQLPQLNEPRVSCHQRVEGLTTTAAFNGSLGVMGEGFITDPRDRLPHGLGGPAQFGFCHQPHQRSLNTVSAVQQRLCQAGVQHEKLFWSSSHGCGARFDLVVEEDALLAVEPRGFGREGKNRLQR